MHKSILILLALLAAQVCTQALFLNSPNFNNYLGATNAQVVKVAGDQSQIFVGFPSGIIKTYSMSGNYLATYNTTLQNNIVQIYWTQLGFGALDTNQYISTWTRNGTYAGFDFFNSSLNGYSVSQSGNTIYAMLNFGTQTNYYNVSLTNGKFTLLSTFSFNSTVTAVQFSSDMQLFFVGLNNNSIVSVNISSAVLSNGYVPTGNSTIKKFCPNYQNNQIAAVTQNLNAYRFQQNPLNTYWGPINVGSSSINGFTGCPSGLFAAASSTTSNIYIYDVNGGSLQTLNYIRNTVTSIDCSNNYLVTVDSSGYLAVNGYINLSKLAAWVIAIIVVFSVLICAAIITIVVCCVRRRRLAMEATVNTTGKELLFTNNTNFQNNRM